MIAFIIYYMIAVMKGFWITEIAEDIIKMTQSEELLKTLYKRLSLVNSDTYDNSKFQSKFMKANVDYAEYVRNIKMDIDYAKRQLSKNC